MKLSAILQQSLRGNEPILRAPGTASENSQDPAIRQIFAFYQPVQHGQNPQPCTVNLCLVTIKYKNPSWTNITVPQKYVFDFKE